MDNKQDVLDLSKRRDSVETRNTPSPYNTSKSTEDSPNARNSENSDYINDRIPSALIPDCMPYDMRYSGLTHLHRNAGTPDFNRSLSPICENSNMQSISASYTNGLYPNPPINPFLLQTALLQKELVQANVLCKDFGGYFDTNPAVIMNKNQMQTNIKTSRPFKVYPHDSFPAAVLDEESAAKYNIFRKRMLEQMHTVNGHVSTTNTKIRRPLSRSSVESHQSIESTTTHNDNNALMETSGCTSSNNTVNKSQITCNTNNNNNKSGSSVKDDAYFERRRKNNAAAKKSRDRRRFKEDEMAIRAAFLERENLELKVELTTIRKQFNALEDKLAFYEAAARINAPKILEPKA